MNVVIYEPDLNPLTIIDLPLSALETGAQRPFVSLQLCKPFSLESMNDNARTGRVQQFTLEFKRLQAAHVTGYCIISHDSKLKAWLMPPYGEARTPREFLRNRDELAFQLRSLLARGVGGH